MCLIGGKKTPETLAEYTHMHTSPARKVEVVGVGELHAERGKNIPVERMRVYWRKVSLLAKDLLVS